MSEPRYVDQGATFDPTGRYRYRLWRHWSQTDRGRVLWVMLNPSTADATALDPTIRRCVGFSQAWGFGGLEVVNLFALRSTDPDVLLRAADPVGPENDGAIVEAAYAPTTGLVVCAWGAHGAIGARARRVRQLLPAPAFCLGLTRHGHPKHPLYLRADVSREVFPR